MTTTRSSQEDLENNDVTRQLLDNENMLKQTFYGCYSDAERVVLEFLQLWTEEDFEGASDLLAHNSPLRGGNLRGKWAERRQAWADNAAPEVTTQAPFLYERGRKPEWIRWLAPTNLASVGNGYKEVEAGWSIKFSETPQDGALPELPRATVIYDQTKSHWFWVCYQLIQEKGKWRIYSMIDEGISIQDLPVEELRSCLQEVETYRSVIHRAGHGEYSNDPLYKDLELSTWEGMHNVVNQMGRCLWYGLCYIDALVKQFPHEYALYDKAYHLLIEHCQYERCLAYVEPLAQFQPTGDNLLRVSGMHNFLSKHYNREGDARRAQRHEQWAEKAFYQKLILTEVRPDLIPEAHIQLAGQLMMGSEEQNTFEDFLNKKDEDEDADDLENLAEAKHHLLQAKTFPNCPEDEAVIEAGLGDLAMRQKDFEGARDHLQRAVELNPAESILWRQLGRAFEHLKCFTDAEACLREAVKRDPADGQCYYSLYFFYEGNNQPKKALAAIHEGLRVCPDSARLHLSMARHHLRDYDFPRAERSLRKAEQLDPESEYVRRTRAMFDVIQSHLDNTEQLFNRAIAQAHLDPTDPLFKHLTNTRLLRPGKRKKRRRGKRNKE